MSCKEWVWNGKKSSLWHVPGTIDQFCFRVAKPPTLNPYDGKIVSCTGLRVEPKAILNAVQGKDVNAKDTKATGRVSQIDSGYASLCAKGRPIYRENPVENEISREYAKKEFVTLEQIFDEVCGCAARKYKFKACPGVAYYMRWKELFG
ncbi:MAG: hypothetical protein HC935_10645, partial [Pseudanabaena sp. SU_2_4]|nr:hypothetical protein [Pseudanabaena sp. SU_2_4]